MDLNTFKDLVKSERISAMPSPYKLTLESFELLKFNEQNENFFLNEASFIVEELRTYNWKKFTEIEDYFSGKMYEQLIDPSAINNVSNKDAIKWFVNEYPSHIYSLSLSNTQSRRSRAGKEFETIIELILMGANIPFDTQGSIGSGVFESKKLSKLVDCVSPGAIEYKINKRNTSLISAKTTLRERWQEVGDEMSRTKAREMYLVTLDPNISQNVTKLINANNIVLVTTKSNKKYNYEKNPHVMTVEDMLEELKTKALTWTASNYSTEELAEKIRSLDSQYTFQTNSFIKSYYENQLNLFSEN
ncbi:type II restriction endonuclease [Marinilactibacillus kalidii]|uniref:type II restriction endonuclease n=1 Tax=Marinilactibacillus kalidii TaxID=2820274 RepID=UPI001ABE9A61|nr:type II restriction endonuclease [Marinilactibacillus kalidii]